MERDEDYIAFIRKIKEKSGIDLAQYKEAQMKRRLTTLRLKHGYTTFVSFYEAMMKDKHLFYEFLDRMTINVSEFWRNPNRWDVLRQTILPELARNNPRLKLWSAACSTGEEPYSLAMILAEAGMLRQTQIHASDLDDGALQRAKDGIYIERSLKEVPPNYVERYFTRHGDFYHIKPELTQSIQFKKQNLLEDSFESQYDLIICRNVMIYFTEEAKSILYHKFSRALRPGGILFVGSTEQIFSPGQYGLESAETFFYRKK
ncbi:chemotaxis protein CheR [Paenibacillus selenitireducens]|uniref:protein-glutamate O-methyltransferase n=1 Tax=Paenibacillus selenitireducens TaxID=1324314 RepID=A0A1T2XNX1_9BACL|nr:protein-glutamate O-methyltransferase CheR [Paenibacillus selenitireducens]OPA81564.1 chemotaxis protein CheR [Paenibacillus selenitireducens]